MVMEMPENEKIESREKNGENVTLVIDLIRHAEKESIHGGLTKQGKEDSEKFGKRKNIKAYYSHMLKNQRTKETAEAISVGSCYVPRKKEKLGIEGKLSQEFIDKFVNLVKQSEGDESKAVQMYLDTDDERPDKNTLSSREVSIMLTTQLLHFVNMTKRLRNNFHGNIALVSHTGVIEHFLADIMKNDRAGFIAKIGGSVKFLEGIRITINRKNKNQVKINASFRGQEITFLEKDLENIVTGN